MKRVFLLGVIFFSLLIITSRQNFADEEVCCDRISLEISADKEEYSLDETVELNISIINQSSSSCYIYQQFGPEKNMKFSVVDENNNIIKLHGKEGRFRKPLYADFVNISNNRYYGRKIKIDNKNYICNFEKGKYTIYASLSSGEKDYLIENETDNIKREYIKKYFFGGKLESNKISITFK